MSDELSIIEELREILDDHALDCTCPICPAYTNGRTPRQGLMDAADALRDQRFIRAAELDHA